MNLKPTILLLVAIALAVAGCVASHQLAPVFPNPEPRTQNPELILSLTKLSTLNPQLSTKLTTNLVTLVWTQSTSANIVSNRLLWGTNTDNLISTELFAATNQHPIKIVGLKGARWVIVITSIDANGIESVQSDVAHWPRPASVITSFTITGKGIKTSADLQNWLPLGDGPLTVDNRGTWFFRGTNAAITPITVQPY